MMNIIDFGGEFIWGFPGFLTREGEQQQRLDSPNNIIGIIGDGHH